jgi:hypothetical protein
MDGRSGDVGCMVAGGSREWCWGCWCKGRGVSRWNIGWAVRSGEHGWHSAVVESKVLSEANRGDQAGARRHGLLEGVRVGIMCGRCCAFLAVVCIGLPQIPGVVSDLGAVPGRLGCSIGAFDWGVREQSLVGLEQ